MEKILLNIKTDRKLKENAQKVAQELGLPLGTIINAYLRDLIREKRVVFSSPPVPNKKTQRLLKKIETEQLDGVVVAAASAVRDAVRTREPNTAQFR